VPTPDLTIDEPLLAQLAAEAESLGLLRLGILRLDHPGLAPAQAALRAYLDAGQHGEMDFMATTRAMRLDPRLLLEGARSALVGLVPYAGVSGPVARYAQWSDYHTEVHRRLARLRERLELHRPGVDTRICVDTKPLLERSLAQLVGFALGGEDFRRMLEYPVVFHCPCGPARALSVLSTLGASDLEALASEQETTEVRCNFCGNVTRLSAAEVRELATRLRASQS